jgi:hypothetical protein
MKTLASLSFVLVLFASTLSIASATETERDPADEVHVLIEPVIGYQSLQRDYPIEHKEGMLTYGGRVVVGTYRLAGEFEMQYGSASETFAAPTAVATTSTLLQARLGARTIVPLIQELHLVFRAGMQGFHYSNEVTIGTTTTTDSPAWQFKPYVGAGVILYMFKALSLSVEEVYVVDTSWETAFGFRLFI